MVSSSFALCWLWQQLSVFGAAADQPKQVLQSLIRQLIAGSALRVNLEKFGALEIAISGGVLGLLGAWGSFVSQARLIEP